MKARNKICSQDEHSQTQKTAIVNQHLQLALQYLNLPVPEGAI